MIQINDKYVTIPASKFEEMEQICNEKQDIKIEFRLYDNTMSIWLNTDKTFMMKSYTYGLTDSIVLDDIIKQTDLINVVLAETKIITDKHIQHIKNRYYGMLEDVSLFDRIFNWKKTRDNLNKSLGKFELKMNKFK